MSKWNIDPIHSNAHFKIMHMGVSWFNGEAFDISGELEFEPEKLTEAKINAKILVDNIKTGNDMRDGHLKSPDFFDIENNPEIRFNSLGIDLKDETSGKLKGELTIKNVKKEITADVTFLGVKDKPKDNGDVDSIAGFIGTTEIDRRDFGLNWNVNLPGGNILVGNTVKLEISIEAILQK